MFSIRGRPLACNAAAASFSACLYCLPSTASYNGRSLRSNASDIIGMRKDARLLQRMNPPEHNTHSAAGWTEGCSSAAVPA